MNDDDEVRLFATCPSCNWQRELSYAPSTPHPCRCGAVMTVREVHYQRDARGGREVSALPFAASRWTDVTRAMPPDGRWVLVWDKSRELTCIAKRRRGQWIAVVNAMRNENVTHWADLIGPHGESCGTPRSMFERTKRDSQS